MWGPPHQIIPTRGVPNDEVQIGDGFIVVDATFHISYVASTDGPYLVPPPLWAYLG